MGNRSEKHVVHNSDRGGWDVKNNNAQRVSKHFDTKADAMDWAREQAKKMVPNSYLTKWMALFKILIVMVVIRAHQKT